MAAAGPWIESMLAAEGNAYVPMQVSSGNRSDFEDNSASDEEVFFSAGEFTRCYNCARVMRVSLCNSTATHLVQTGMYS